MASEPTVTLLHLSDLQLGPHHRFDPGSELGSLLGRLREDLDDLAKTEELRPDLVLVTGDLAEHGLRSQFEEVSCFVEALASQLGLQRRRLVLVPGNHDINWKLSSAYFDTCAGNEEQPRPPYWPKLHHYADFFARFYEGYPDLQFTEAEPWSFFAYPELKVVVAGLNSTIAESHRSEDHYGYLGEAQIRAMVAKLRPYQEQGYLRIAAVHHDLLQPPEGNERARQDLKDLKRMLGPYINLILHGHLHEEQLQWLDGAVPVLGIGSAGIKPSGRPPEVPNQVQIVQVRAEQLLYAPLAYVPDQKRWIEDLRVDREGRSRWAKKRVLFERVEATFSAIAPAEAAPRAELSPIVASYRSHVAKTWRRQALFDVAGLAEDADIAGGLDLLNVFVPQRARREVLPEPLPESTPERASEELDDEVIAGPIVPVEEALTSESEPWVLLLGGPGAGKSTLTRWLALKLCAPGESMPGMPSELVPVRIEMRRFDVQYRHAREAGRTYSFFDYLDEVHRERSLRLRGAPLLRLAEEGRLVWLIDGLDEVAEAHARCDYAEMIVGLKERYGGRGVVTSRSLGARPAQPVLREAGFGQVALLDFSDEESKSFIDRWHVVAFPGAPEVGARRRERLLKTMEETRAVRELCASPLLLTTIALLNRGGELPRRRHLIYARAVELMAAQWEANKQLPRGSASRFELPEKQRFLRGLAFRMMTVVDGGTGNVIEERELLEYAATFCRQTYGEDDERAKLTAAALIRDLRERNSVIALLGGQVFGFVHKTFLEYLAAAEIHARYRGHEWGMEELKDIFRRRWQDPPWEEVLLLICGMLDEDRPERVVEVLQGMLVGLDVDDQVRAWQTTSFAARCLAELTQLDQDPARRFGMLLTERLLAPLREDSSGTVGVHLFYSTLRLRGVQWPGAEMIRGRALRKDPGARIDYSIEQLVCCALLIMTPGHERSRVLADIICAGVRTVGTAISVASRYGPWSDNEVDQLAGRASERGDQFCASVLFALLSSGAASALEHLVRLADRIDNRLTLLNIARALVRVAAWEGRGFAILKTLIVDAVREKDARVLLEILRMCSAESGIYGPIRHLIPSSALEDSLEGDGLRVNGWLLGELRISAFDWMRGVVERLLRVPLDEEVAHLVVRMARNVLRDGTIPAGLAERLAEIARTSDPAWPSASAASLLYRIPGWTDVGLEILEQRGWIHELIRISIVCEADLPRLRSLIIEGRTEESRVAAATSALRLDFAVPLRAVAMGTLILLAASASSEQARMSAARALKTTGVSDDAWRGTLLDLVKHAQAELVRLQAAKALEDTRSLSALAEQTSDSSIRNEVLRVLEIHRLQRALLQVGRPRRGRVALDGSFVGYIEETPHGSRFLYDPSYLARPEAIPISPTLPLRKEPYESSGLHPFFENLLPEGRLLDLTCRKLRIDRTDAFGLLLATCADCAGAVEITPDELAA